MAEGRELDIWCNALAYCTLRIPPGFTVRSSTISLLVLAQPAKKEYVNEGGEERKNPREHLGKPCGQKAVRIAGLRSGAGLGRRQAARKLDLQRHLSMGAPEPIRHRCRKNNQQQRKQVYAAFLSQHGFLQIWKRVKGRSRQP